MAVDQVNLPDLSGYPGGDLVHQGLLDLASGTQSVAALLVMVASPRLRALGLPLRELPQLPISYEHALFEAIEARRPEGAHAEYNALIAKVVSFANAYRRELN